MNLLAFSDNPKIIQSLQDAISGSVHTIEIANLTEISSGINFSDYDGIITDRKSWQRSASLFKYFGLLNALNNMPLMILTTDGKKVRIKLRDSGLPVVHCSYPVVGNEILSNIEKLISVGQPQEI